MAGTRQTARRGTQKSRRPRRRERSDFRVTDPALPLNASIRSRVGNDFDVERMIEPQQKQLSTAIYSLFGTVLESAVDDTLTLNGVRARVQETHADTMSKIQSSGSGSAASFWVERNSARVHLARRAVRVLETLSPEAVAQHLWTLWQLDVSKTKESRWTFLGTSLDRDQRPSTGVSTRQQILNRALYDAFQPFIASDTKPQMSWRDLSSIIQSNMNAGRDNVEEMARGLTRTRPGRYMRWILTQPPSSISTMMNNMWKAGIFDSGKALFDNLAPPFNIHPHGALVNHEGDDNADDDDDDDGEHDRDYVPPLDFD
ncbi:hypothetical protein F5B20DRAFT_592442 [Whalleya microplaca]|nr:hypothetical protein F5B20DRAFT_592442 [Whalleya microplaca]